MLLSSKAFCKQSVALNEKKSHSLRNSLNNQLQYMYLLRCRCLSCKYSYYEILVHKQISHT